MMLRLCLRLEKKNLKDELKKFGLLIKDVDDMNYIVINKSDMSKTIDLIRFNNGEVISIVPKRKTLEDIFIKEIGI